MSVVPQAANSEGTPALFGVAAESPRLKSSHSFSGMISSQEGDESSPSAVALAPVASLAEHANPSEVLEATGETRDTVELFGPECSEVIGEPNHAVCKLHRVAEVRLQQGISERTMARRLGMDLKSYRELEDPARDLSLSQLNVLQRALDVPLADLLEDHYALSRPVHERAKLLKVMKTAVALREAKINTRVDRMAAMLCDQLVDLMPELAEVSGWPQFGARRGVSAVGRALQNPIDTSGLSLPD